MADAQARVVVDWSVVVKWKLPLEEHAAAAEALLLAWEQQTLAVCAPQHLPAEVMRAFLRAAGFP